MIPDQKSSTRIGIVVSRFNEEITSRLLEGAISRLKELKQSDPTVVHVPGAIEIPLVAQKLAQTGHYDAIVCLGAVIRGETSHFDFVCQQVSMGCQNVMLSHGLPIIFGVLTTENEEQAMERLGGKHGHKGRDCADAAVEMVSIIRSLTH